MSENVKGDDFKPYVPAEKTERELTVASVVVGALLAVVFGAANAYLGLRVGMTVSASIPAAVISMAVMRVILRRNSLLESNMVQTIGSAGESLAGGVIMTMPVFFLWAEEGAAESPGPVALSILALCGGVIGVLLMIPLRHSLMVEEHGVLPYPEGTACAEVLLAAEKAGEGEGGGKGIFAGIGIAALAKLLTDGLGCIPGTVTAKIESLKTEFSAEAYPALVGVGYICGARVSAYMLAGGVLGWFVLIPAIAIFGGGTVLFPATQTVAELYAQGGAGDIWSNFIRYVGAGMVAAGGVFSLVKSLPGIAAAVGGALRGMQGGGGADAKRTERDLNLKAAMGAVAALLVALVVLPGVPVAWPGAVLILLIGLFFGAVSARIVGIVGSSNNPVSGMTIAAMLGTALVFKLIGADGTAGMVAAIAVGSVTSIVMAIAGDTSQDLKTGFLLGATPKKQQIGEIIGVAASAAVIGGVMILLNSAWQFGSKEMAAPQATMMKMLVEGVMSGNLPWTLIFIGAFLAVSIELLGIPVLPVAIGLYLPLELSVTVMAGGAARWLSDWYNRKKGREGGSGILFCSGLVAGEGLVGILLAVVAVAGLGDAIDLSSRFSTGPAGGVGLLVFLAACVLWYGRGKETRGHVPPGRFEEDCTK